MASNKWGVVVGKPTELHPNKNDGYIRHQIGNWVFATGDEMEGPNYEALFNTRYEAIKRARQCSKDNRYWNFRAKKFPQ